MDDHELASRFAGLKCLLISVPHETHNDGFRCVWFVDAWKRITGELLPIQPAPMDALKQLAQ